MVSALALAGLCFIAAFSLASALALSCIVETTAPVVASTVTSWYPSLPASLMSKEKTRTPFSVSISRPVTFPP